MVKHVQTTVGDGVFDVPLVGFYAATFPRPNRDTSHYIRELNCGQAAHL